MEPLHNRQMYGETTAIKIEVMGSTAVSIANRWTLGWPQRVLTLLAQGQFIEKLIEQTALEKDILANAADLAHLSRGEILEMNRVSQEPPQATQVMGWA